ncbi:MAG: murein biosynthesis integral membrane protein MurJ [Anaerolineae bacterium]
MSLDPTTEIEPVPPEPSVSVTTGGVVRAAAIISLGNVLSRVLGLARETVIADLFGASGYVSIFRVAATIIQTLYDFLVGGMVSAALVPVLSEYADRREELWRLASVVFSVLAFFLALAVLVLELFAPELVWLLGSGYDPALQAAAVPMIRLILPAVFFLGFAGLVTGLLYSLKRFAFPAFTTSAYNAAIIIVALLLTPQLGILSLVVGILIGAASQVVLQLPGLRDVHIHLALDFRHPALRQILKLYLPVVAGLAISTVGVFIDRNLASRTGNQSLAWMQDATVLIQFPLGLVATAISFAILPNLSRALDGREFRSTLGFGLKLVLLLILPAAAGLALLAIPIVALLFEHGAFTSVDTSRTAQALQLYLIGLPFAAIDQPLVFAFYARKNTLAPNLVAVVGVGAYLVVAFALIQPFGMLGLVLANSAQLTVHAFVMLYLVQTRLGGLGELNLSRTLLKLLAATALMGAALFLVLPFIPAGEGLVYKLARVFIPGTAALVVYLVALRLFRVQEADQLVRAVLTRVRARQTASPERV